MRLATRQLSGVYREARVPATRNLDSAGIELRRAAEEQVDEICRRQLGEGSVAAEQFRLPTLLTHQISAASM